MSNNKKKYFGEQEEKAVLEYVKAETQEERDRIYEQYLKDPLNKMIESIIRTYNLQRKGVSFEDLHQDTLSFLIIKADKFDEEKNTKAFSYYGTIVRNYLRNQLMDDDKKTKRNIPYEDVHYNLENDEEYSYELDDDEYTLNEFLKDISDEIKKEVDEDKEKKVSKKLTENEKKVGNAVIEILDKWEEAYSDMNNTKKFNKMSILSSIREMTGLSTKDIRIAMKRFKKIYSMLKKYYMDEGLL